MYAYMLGNLLTFVYSLLIKLGSIVHAVV